MRKFLLTASFACCCFSAASLDAAAQPAVVSPTPVLADDSRPRREQGYLKLLDGQRHLWKAQRLQTQAGKANSMRLAKAAFQQAIELDPQLAEGYTALAEIAVSLPPVDLEEAVRLSSQAVKTDHQNFGGHRMLARLYTIKSRLNNGTPDKLFADRAVAEWKEVTRLDPRNAEGWAFLSEFADDARELSVQIEALRNWVAAATPIDVQFYGRIMGGASLTPETASLKLAGALQRDGKPQEATTVLSALISDDAENAEAISLLGELLESAEGDAALAARTALQQAVYANPANVSLIDMLARLQVRLGQFDEAVELLRRYLASLARSDKRAASTVAVSLAELYLEKDRYDDAAKAFESGLSIRGIGPTAIKDEDREFAQYVFEKLIHAAKLSNRPENARAQIERSRQVFGSDDLFADRQSIMLMQSEGRQAEALALLRSVRGKRPAEIGLLRQEASLLTGLGRVDEAVALIKNRQSSAAPAGIDEAGTVSVTVAAADNFSDLLFISNLYTKANRGAEAVTAANQAVAIAAGTERRQIAKVTLATGQQMSGDTAGAELTLREVLKEGPGNPIALNNLGYFLVERGEKLSEAIEMISQAIKVDPKNPSYLDSLGWAYYKLGKFNDAEKYLTDAARADADSATIREHLGDLYLAKKEGAKARTYWEKALRLSTEAAEISRLKKKLNR